MCRSWPPVASQNQPSITSQLEPAPLHELQRGEDSIDTGVCPPPAVSPITLEFPPLHMPKRQYDRFNTPLPKRGRFNTSMAEPDFMEDKRARMRDAAEKRERMNRTAGEQAEQSQSSEQESVTVTENSNNGKEPSIVRCLKVRNRG